jgi:WD40 repeat protein
MPHTPEQLLPRKHRSLPLGFVVVAAYLGAVAFFWWWLPTSSRLTVGQPGDRFLGFTPDSTQVIAQSGKTLCFWDVQTGAERLRLPLDPDWRTVVLLLFPPEGQHVAAWEGGGKILLWDLSTKQVQARMETFAPVAVPRPQLLSAWMLPRFAPDGTTFAVPGQEGDELHLWDVTTGQRRLTLPGIRRYTFAPDGQTLAVAERLWGEVNPWWPWELLHRLTRMEAALPTLAYAVHSTLPELDCIRLRDLRTGQPVGRPFGFVLNANTLFFSRDGRQLAVSAERLRTPAGEVSVEVHRWEPVSARELPVIQVGLSTTAPWAGSVRFSADGQRLLLDQHLAQGLWDVTTQPPRQLLPLVDGPMLSPDMQTVAIYSGDTAKLGFEGTLDQKRMRLVNLNTRRDAIPLIWDKAVDTAWPLGFSPDGRLLAIKVSFDPHEINLGNLRQRFFNLFSDKAAPENAEELAEMRLVEVATGKTVGTVPKPVYGIAFAPDGQTMILSGARTNQPLELWDVPPAKPWLLILAWAVLPAVIVLLLGLVRQWWQQRRQAKVAALVALAQNEPL